MPRQLPKTGSIYLTERELVELERIGDRMRERYRHLMSQAAERNYWDRQRAESEARWARAERFDGQELADDFGGDEDE